MPTIKPQNAFADQMAKAARASTQAGKTITTTEADKALTSLASLAPKAKVAAVEAFLASTGANKLSPAARDTLRDFVARNDHSHPPALSVRPPPYMKFMDAVQHAVDHGKVKGQITKGEIQKAFKHIESLPMASQKALAQELLAGPHADNLSKAARAIVEARADVAISIWGPSTEAVGEEGGGHMVTLAIPENGGSTEAVGEEGGATTMAMGEEGGGRISTEAVGEEGGGRVSTMAVGEEGGGRVSTEAVGEEGGGRATTMAMGEEGGGSTEAVGEEGGGLLTMAIPEGGATTMAMGEEGGFTTEAIGEE